MWAGTMGLLMVYVRQVGLGQNITTFLANVPFDPLDPAMLPFIRLPVVLVAAIAAPLTYLWGRHILGETGAVLAALFLALDPFLLALSRVLGHDALVAIFMWLSLLAFLRADASFLVTPVPGQTSSLKADRRYLFASGALGGLAFLTKYPSLYLGAFVAMTLLVLYIGRGGAWRQVFRDWLASVLLWSLAAGLVFCALWPAMWVDPLGRVAAIINDALRASGSPHPKGSFFLGQPVPDPGMGFYVLASLFRTTPLIWLGWVLLLAEIALGRTTTSQSPWMERPGRRVVLILLAYALLYGVLVTVGGKKQDRYILPAFPALVTLAALGYGAIANVQSAIKLKSRISNLNWLLLPILVAQAALVLSHYPYYFTYYNPLIGGGPAAARAMLVGWGEGLDQAARWLNTQPDAQDLDVVAWYSTTFEPYFRGHAIYEIEEEKISRTSKPGLAADYVVLYINQIQRQLPSPGALQFFQAASPVYTVTLHGIGYAWIHPSLAMQHVFPDDMRLVGQGELLGYNLTDGTGQPITEVYPDSVVYLSLYWEWQGKAEEEPIGVSLVDAEGVTRGWGNPIQTAAPLPFAEWQEGMIVRDDFALVIFSDTPPGAYRLTAWIDRPATGETVGVFPLGNEVMIRVVGDGT
jgi:4-amino-4-deoxy-L-arabinose transferase-like glycosyltransferase